MDKLGESVDEHLMSLCDKEKELFELLSSCVEAVDEHSEKKTNITLDKKKKGGACEIQTK